MAYIYPFIVTSNVVGPAKISQFVFSKQLIAVINVIHAPISLSAALQLIRQRQKKKKIRKLKFV